MMIRKRSRGGVAATALTTIVLALAGCADKPSPHVRDYVVEALDFIEQYGLHVDTIHWDSIREDTLERTADAQSFDAVHGDIALAVVKAGGNHSSFSKPASATDGVTLPLELPAADVLEDGIARMTIPFFAGSPEEAQRYVDEGLASLMEVGVETSCGWIVDLRGNRGGNMYPMLAALSPFFTPDTVVGGLQDRHGITAEVTVEPGRVSLDGQVLAVGSSDVAALDAIPVAVLHDRLTTSSGEVVAAAFRGRSGTLSFGLPTGGYVSGNISRVLSDGAQIVLTTAHVIDGNGEVLPSTPIQPDVIVASGGDAAERAAIDWLRDGCDGGSIP